MAQFEYLRVSLAKQPAPLLDRIEMNRQDFLREVLSKRWVFPYRGKSLVYDPIPLLDDNVLGGVVGRQVTELKSEGPDDQWRPVEHKYWPHALLAVDVGETEQIAVFQKDTRVGSPRRMLQRLMEFITADAPYRIWRPNVEYISNSEDFWAAAKEYSGRISLLDFIFVPPNMLRAKEKIDELVRAASDEAHSEETMLRLKSDEGSLVADGDLVRAAVSTAAAGGGEILMKSGRKTIYSSSKNRKTLEVDPVEIPEPSNIDRVRGFFRRLVLR